MTELERSHAELRAALRIAGKRIAQLQFGQKDDPALAMLRKVLRESRKVLRESRKVAAFYFQSSSKGEK